MSARAADEGRQVRASVLLVAAAIVDVQASATGRTHWRDVADELTAYAAQLVPGEGPGDGESA